jgi:hypothetical protein
MEGVTVNEQAMVSHGSFEAAMDFLLEEEGVTVKEKLFNLVSATSLRRGRIQRVGIEDDFDIKR